jgi:undecaprenyl-diphosphatase
MFKILVEKLTSFDILIINWVTIHRNHRVRKAFHVITFFGSFYFWFFIYLFLFLFCSKEFRPFLYSFFLAETTGLFIIIILRIITKRERPKKDSSSFLSWQDYSFPSQHSFRVAMLATIIGSFSSSFLPFLIIVAFIISISRIYLERHYPCDVFVGSLIGLICSFLVLLFF